MVGIPEYWHIGKIRIGFEDQVFQSQSKNSRLRPFISFVMIIFSIKEMENIQ
jgi:hypothetical protein